MKKIVFALLMLGITGIYAQTEKEVDLNKETNLIDVVYYHDNGQISQKGSYTLEGKLQGNWQSFNLEGNKISQGNYENGQKSGKWFFWTEEGKLREVDYRQNKIASVQEWTNSTNVAVRDK